MSGAFWKGRFQQRWCSSQQSFLSQKEKRKHFTYLIRVGWPSGFTCNNKNKKKQGFTYLPPWPQQRHCQVYIYWKRHHTVHEWKQMIPLWKCDSLTWASVFPKSCISKCEGNILVKMRPSTNIYLKDSMPFFVPLTKNGNLSILVTSTSPPLLSITPKWIAALQILDCWNKRKFESQIMNICHRTTQGLCPRPDSPHRSKGFPKPSPSYSGS